MASKKAIIYDNTCPMCQWYTAEFVKSGLLERENRIAFAELEKKGLAGQLDLERSRDEIPLVDLDGGETLYGLDSMVHLLAPRFPLIPKLLALQPIGWAFRKLYKLVSYNRRVMAPSRKVEQVYDCTPHFNWGYRWMYILLGLLLGWIGVASFSAEFLPATYLRLIIAVFLALLLPVFILKQKRAMEYVGQVSTVWLVGGILLLPAFILPGLWWFFGVAALGIMIWQLLRRGRLMFQLFL